MQEGNISGNTGSVPCLAARSLVPKEADGGERGRVLRLGMAKGWGRGPPTPSRDTTWEGS